jgi:hypothetical protein
LNIAWSVTNRQGEQGVVKTRFIVTIAMTVRFERRAAMTPLPESRLRGLAEKLGCQIALSDPGWIIIEPFDFHGRSIDMLQEDWRAAGFILKRMERESLVVIRRFAAAVIPEDLNPELSQEDTVGAVLVTWLTPSRIAEAAADALEIE